jgi:hypothetical protein
MKNIKSYNEVNEGFFDTIKSLFTGDKNAATTTAQTLKQDDGNKNIMVELCDMFFQSDGSIASDDKIKSFFKTSLNKPGEPDSNKGTNTAMQIAGFLGALKKLSPESLESTFKKGNGEVTSYENEIKKILG